MLIPNKHSHADETVLAATTLLLKELRTSRVVGFTDLRAKLNQSPAAEYLFTPAVSLLYLLGLTNYLPTSDTFEYTGPL